MSGLEKIKKIRSLPLVGSATIFKTPLKPRGISTSDQHMKVAPIPQISNAVSHTSFWQMVKKLQRKPYQKNWKFWKTEFCFWVILKLLSNRKELESVVYMKKLRLDDIFPTPYRLLHSDQPFRKNPENTFAVTRWAPIVFRTALTPRGISKSVQHGEVADFL